MNQISLDSLLNNLTMVKRLKYTINHTKIRKVTWFDQESVESDIIFEIWVKLKWMLEN